MDIEELAGAIQTPRPWLERFLKRDCEDAFQEYQERYGPLYDSAAREAEDLGALAESLMDAWERGWRRHRFFDRSGVRAEEKQVLAVYLTPMLLARREPACQVLCRRIQEAWTARRPRDGYQLADFQTLRAGFRNSVLGIPLKDR